MHTPITVAQMCAEAPESFKQDCPRLMAELQAVLAALPLPVIDELVAA